MFSVCQDHELWKPWGKEEGDENAENNIKNNQNQSCRRGKVRAHFIIINGEKSMKKEENKIK